MIYITGDTHGEFERIENFCQMNRTSKDDIMIILGDAGINFSGPMYDSLKKEISCGTSNYNILYSWKS